MTRHLGALAASQGIRVRGHSSRAGGGRTAILYTLTGGSLVAREAVADAMVARDPRTSRATHRRTVSVVLFLIGA